MKGSLEYRVGKLIYTYFKSNSKVEIVKLESNRIKNNIPGDDISQFYRHGKKNAGSGDSQGYEIPVLQAFRPLSAPFAIRLYRTMRVLLFKYQPWGQALYAHQRKCR